MLLQRVSAKTRSKPEIQSETHKSYIVMDIIPVNAGGNHVYGLVADRCMPGTNPLIDLCCAGQWREGEWHAGMQDPSYCVAKPADPWCLALRTTRFVDRSIPEVPIELRGRGRAVNEKQ